MTTAAQSHTGGTATWTEQAKCEACGKAYGQLAAHNYGDVTYQLSDENKKVTASRSRAALPDSALSLAEQISVYLVSIPFVPER